MMGKPKRLEPKLFYSGVNLADRIPREYPLRRIKRAIDFDFVRGRVRGRYGYNGHESLDPALTLKLMFLGFYENVRSERELLRQLPMRIDWLWFCDLDLDEAIPHHSVLSKARRRWGLELFEEVFARILRLCVEAGLVDGKTVYADSSLLKANASLDSRVPRWFWNELEQTAEGSGESDEQGPAGGERTPPAAEDTQAQELPPPPTGRFNRATLSRTDPDAATCKRRGRGVTLGYRDHCLVDNRHGVVVATIATPGDYDDAALLGPLLEKYRRYTGSKPKTAVGDSLYGTSENIGFLRAEGIEPYLKRRTGSKRGQRWLERLPGECRRWRAMRLMKRRMHLVEGRFAEAHERFGHRRCRWRRRWRVQIQCYLVAIVQNIGKLLRHGAGRRPAVPQKAAVFRAITTFAQLLRAALAPLMAEFTVPDNIPASRLPQPLLLRPRPF